ncbi:LAMI_0C00364g1_1 [Lachancea mirantina]|uniref:LAMI_0C00364g1_1 n=1 Tax=Lachancea mirantina TaxID=1230905 RepID=A0A1G4IZV5_9SACH|nr:LAMI_0C00364g1_1 [Lachancea mirantina]
MSSSGLEIPVNASAVSSKASPVGNLATAPMSQASQQQQHQQRLLMQQKMKQQQQQQHQAMQNFENQFYQFLITINKKPKRLYNFAEDTDAILKKYEQFRPSFEFHIYDNNYKICAPANTRLQQQQRVPQTTSDGLILNKNNETLKEFLEYVARGQIPEAIMEVLKDCNVQFYEGNLILQVYDHTNTVDVKQSPSQSRSQQSPPSNGTEQKAPEQQQQQRQQPQEQQQPPSEGQSQSTPVSASSSITRAADAGVRISDEKSEDGSVNNENQKHGKEPIAVFKRPRVYRTLLRPNGLTHYYDMLSYADHTRFSDNIYQQLEAEILTITKRNLDLNVQLSPFEHQGMLDHSLFLKPELDPETGKVEHCHRPLSFQAGTKGEVGHIEQHEELPQHSSTYEQMMLIMSERTSTTTMSTIAASLAQSAVDLTSSSLKGGSGKGSSASTTSGRANSSNTVAAAAVAAAAAVGGSTENNQFSRLKFIEQWRINKEKRKQQAMSANTMPNAYNARISMSAPLTAQQLKQQQIMQQHQQQASEQQRSVNKRAADDDKAKPKKSRKATKKAAPSATSAGAADAGKKKRSTKKK